MIKSFILIFLLASAKSKRISEEKCLEYKDLLKHTQCVGFSVFDPCPGKIISYDCGDVGNTGLIVGGEEAKPGEFPHMAALFLTALGWEYANGNLAFKCGGSLISDRFVLTAAHCGWDQSMKSEPVWIRLGVQNLAVNGLSLVQLKIKSFIKHPEYDSKNNDNDIALIELEKSVKFDNKLLRPACLQQQEYFGENITATGWGQNKTYGETLDTLMKVSLPIADIYKCEESLDNLSLNKEKQICVGGVKGKDTCRGDSGGPIQYAHEDAKCVYNVIGLTSVGNFVCGGGHAVYTKTLQYLDWIEGIVWPETTTTLRTTTTSRRYFKGDDWIW